MFLLTDVISKTTETNSIVDIIAILGFCISLIALVLSLQTWWKGRFNLKIHATKYHSTVFPVKSKKDAFGQAVFSLEFINKSNMPISIYKIAYEVNSDKIYLTHNITSDIIEGSNGVRTIAVQDKVDLPLRLGSYDAVRGIIHFPKFPATQSGKTIKLTIYTSRKRINITYEVLEGYVRKLV